MLAREFLLLGFAFSSVVSSAEIILPSRPADTKTVRVSRLADSTGGSTLSPLDRGLEKRAIEVGQKEQDGGSQNSLYDGGSEDLSKRNRMGFTGMRGKKEMDPPSRYDADNYGKRALRNYKELLGGKRAPLAFHGMRGKKSGDYDADWFEPEYLNLAIPSSRLFDDGNDILEYPELGRHREEEDSFGEDPIVSKRSPYSFQGMRGKKTSDYDLKRAMGFLGMRGKKSIEVWNPEEYKRAPQSAFFGMKGKKAQSGFFGMRGKKPFWTSWYGIQGIPAGVLGKDYQGISFLDHLREDEPSSTRLRRGSPWLYNDKKAKNAFFGIKGKKSTDESSFPGFTESAE